MTTWGRIVLIIGVVCICPAIGLCAEQVPKVTRPPNVVLIAIDTLRADHLSCYGYSKPTSPNIDRLASEGVLFENCYSTASWTIPAFMSIFTGLMPAAHGCVARDSRLLETIPTLPEQFKKQGYYCGAIVSSPCVRGKYGFSRGFDLYDDYSILLGVDRSVTDPDALDKDVKYNDLVTGASVTKEAASLMDTAKQPGKPAFLFIHYFDPHDSYVPPPPYNTKFCRGSKCCISGKGMPAMRNNPPGMLEIQGLLGLYDGEIAYTDEQIGKLLDKLDKVFDPTNTLIIFVSDHGEAFGEHGRLLHGRSPYCEEVCVPMIWRWPGVLPGGHRVTSAVSSVDIARTLTELMRFEELDLLQGESLWPALTGGQMPDDRYVYSQKANTSTPNHHVALSCGKLRLHMRFDRKPGFEDAKFELYDTSNDRLEQKNILQAAPTKLAEMKSSIQRHWRESLEIRDYYRGGEDTLPRGDMTEQQRRQLESMGYIGGAR